MLFKSIATITLGALAGCMNMPTPTSQITGSYTSNFRYESFDCSRLAAEIDSLSRRETQLVVAQEQRVKTSQMQAFWWGFGQGDGIEASELAQIRGEREAVIKAIQIKGCAVAPAAMAPILVPPEPPPKGNPSSNACAYGVGAAPCPR